MPTATPFQTFALCGLPAVDVTIGEEINFIGGGQIGTIVDYITLGGHRGSSGSSATQASIYASYVAAHKLYYNFHGIEANATTTGSVSASEERSLSFDYVSSIDSEGNETISSASISASASSSISGFSESFPSYTITSNQPINRICGSPQISAGFFEANNSQNDFDSNSDTFDVPYGSYNPVVVASASTGVAFEGLGNGPDFELGFSTKSPAIFRFYDSGNFVGYGISPLFAQTYYIGAGAGASGHPSQDTGNGGYGMYCGSVYTDDVDGLDCNEIDTDTFSQDGVHLYLVAGTVDTNATTNFSVSGRSINFSNSSTYPSTTITSYPADRQYVTNQVLVSTGVASASHDFNFDFDLQFYTY